MKKINLVFLAFVMLAVVFAPVIAEEHDHEEYAENGRTVVLHFAETILIIVMVAFAFLAANMFAQDLGMSMKLLAGGLALVGLNAMLEGLHHFNIHILPVAVENDSFFHHIIGMIGFVIMTIAFYKIWTVAKGVKKK